MKPSILRIPPAAAALLALFVTLLPASPGPGGEVWSKHVDTSLLAEPRPLAPPVASIGFAQKLTVLGVQGAWLQVQGEPASARGWVFQGNVAVEKPSLPPATGWTTVDASATDTVAAARPLTPAAADYATRHDGAGAEADIDWLDARAAALSLAQIVGYLQANGKGEYQP
jgi:hypothetical protein